MMKPKQSKEQLKSILEKHEYQAYYDHSKSLFEKLKEWAGHWLSKWLHQLFPDSNLFNQADKWGAYVLVGLGVGLFIVLVYFLQRNLAKTSSIRSKSPLQQTRELEWSYERHLEEAEALQQEEQFGEAMRHVFLALLLYFHEQEWVEAKPWKTNWEYYEELKRVNYQTAEKFYQLAMIFEEAAYGNREIKQNEYKSYQQQAAAWLMNRNKHRES
ncbi:DUF4129 domain-containing protein [Halobacillus rhizosphaerae]|uniref:DUF4129 domain-containing protein n=1 Tax=Halobacillus rhizosphaerae TaxID=3064889 RepID=UPI00398AC4EE